MRITKRKKLLRIIVISLLLFLGVSAVAGSWGLIRDPSGRSVQIPIELLEHSPFGSYLIPGIFLLVLNGIQALIIAFLTLKKTRGYHYLILLQGVVLILWLSSQLLINFHFFYPLLHIPYFLMGAMLTGLGSILGRSEKRS